jgi:sortase A
MVTRLRGTLRSWIGVERIFWIVGCMCLGYWGVVTAEAWVFQRIHLSAWEAPRTEPTVAAAAIMEAPPSGAVIGRIDLPDVGIEAVVVEGVDDRELRLAVGHVPGTALPGADGNCVLAGHRDTSFRGLREIQVGHVIRLASSLGETHYRVRETKIVEPNETEVLHPTEGRVLTLVTCYPFSFVGTAPQRFIVVADAVNSSKHDG